MRSFVCLFVHSTEDENQDSAELYSIEADRLKIPVGKKSHSCAILCYDADYLKSVLRCLILTLYILIGLEKNSIETRESYEKA